MLAFLKSWLRGNSSVGVRGERIASKWLKRRGYRILERNLKLGDDEADLVAMDPDQRTIVIVEVKTRSEEQSSPEQSVTPTKQHRLNRLASALQRRKWYRDHPMRFDAIAIVIPKTGEPLVRHIPGAFQSKW